ncbi:MAG: hypothetical protein KGH79_04625 [Patescibacteria group bacterium]|nr:hypothetical protein [Patescibacteria group bacterium]
MSKETAIIVLGLWVVILPYLGIPGGWRTTLLILSGIALMVLGFLLRGDALSRGSLAKEHRGRNSYVENTASITQDYSTHDHKEGITSLN